jgi:hypothetical protein
MAENESDLKITDIWTEDITDIKQVRKYWMTTFGSCSYNDQRHDVTTKLTNKVTNQPTNQPTN